MNRQTLAAAVRASLVRLPPPYDNHYGVVPPAPPEHGVNVSEILDRLVAATAAIGRVGVIARELSDPYLISRILKRQEAVSSSAIENTHSTLDELLTVDDVMESHEDQEEIDNQVRQVRDYAILLDRLVPEAAARGYDIFTLDTIRRVHAEVMRGNPDYEDVPGALRERVVWIGGLGQISRSTWNPPPPDRVLPCLMQTIDYLRNEGMQSMTQNLVVRMAIAHAHFEAVHPFRDGNGRVGRLLFPLMMAADGEVPLYLSPFIDAHKDAYYDALRRAQQRLEWGAIIGFMADAIVATVDEVEVTRAALARLRGDWMTRRRFRRAAASTRALDLLPHYPILTVKRLATLLNVTFTQASQAVDHLVSVGILTERTGYARNRIFAANEVLRIINRPFGRYDSTEI